MGEKAVELTVDEALGVVAGGPEVHVFMNPGGMLLGADWQRDDVENAIRKSETRQVGGAFCRGMGHGLVVLDDGRWIFVAHDEAKLAEIESSKAEA